MRPSSGSAEVARRSATRPMPSVLSPKSSRVRRTIVLTASRELRPRRQLVHEVGGACLCGTVTLTPRPPGTEELEHVVPETPGGDSYSRVVQVLLRLAREQAVDERRPAVATG